MDKVEVKNIDIKIGDKTISLKPEQAKALKQILNEMFEETKVVHEHHYDHYRYWWTYPHNPSPYWTITYGAYSSSTAIGVMQNNITSVSNLASYKEGNVTLCLNDA